MVSGSLAILAEESDGRELLLAYVHPGDFIGASDAFRGLWVDLSVTPL